MTNTSRLCAFVLLWLAACFAPASGRREPDEGQRETPAASQDEQQLPRPEFAEAGVCARCHVNVVLEWGISGHVEIGTTCQECHGPSEAHVANERNEIRPDRLPRGKLIAKLCSTCHGDGCPETLRVASCQDCHHVHALLNPNVEGREIQKVQDEHLKEVLVRLVEYREAMAEGEGRVEAGRWQQALGAFERALKVRPGDRTARERLAMCRRRIDPELHGFRIVGERFDKATGLPLEVVVEEIELPMVLVPGGEFDMGDERYREAQPVHTVAVGPFYLGKYEVTQAQWAAVMGSNPSRHQGERFPEAARMPVEQVSWDACGEFVERLNHRVAGGGFRLPTEAEWEFAASSPPSPPYQGGPRGSATTGLPNSAVRKNATLEELAWFRANSLLVADAPERREDIDDYSPRPVGTKRANAIGLFDLQGNVWEWCSSRYWPYLYDSTDGRETIQSRDREGAPEPRSPALAASGTQSVLPRGWPTGLRVLRGGGYADGADQLHPGLRYGARSGRAFRWFGMRLARSVPTATP